jgi:D-tyrosyl-tRNA(Tyr) deacylase
MRVVVQRVKRAQVTVGAELVGRVGPGLLVLLGAGQGDGAADVDYLVEKVVNLRIFEDDAGKMNRSLLDCGGGLLVVSQFTLYGDCRRGRRPSFTEALEPAAAAARCDEFVARARALGVTVATGRFGAMMDVELVNDGPVTLLLDSRKAF